MTKATAHGGSDVIGTAEHLFWRELVDVAAEVLQLVAALRVAGALGIGGVTAPTADLDDEPVVANRKSTRATVRLPTR